MTLIRRHRLVLFVAHFLILKLDVQEVQNRRYDAIFDFLMEYPIYYIIFEFYDEK